MGDDGSPAKARKDWRRRRNLHVRHVNDCRQDIHRVLGSVGCSARAFDRLGGDQVVPHVKRLHREAGRKQTQHRYFGESWDHDLHWVL